MGRTSFTCTPRAMRESSVSSSLSAAVVSMVSSFDSFRMRASVAGSGGSISSWAFAMFMKDKSPESFAMPSA